jgi:kynurenine formamidase
MGYRYLSYVLNETTPAYGDGRSLDVEQINDMTRGHTCNTQVWHLPNHVGTHIDMPLHFCRNGAGLDRFPADFWICSQVCHIRLAPVIPGQIITSLDLKSHVLPPSTDLLLLETGFGIYRGENVYMLENPGIDPELADYLRKTCPCLKMIGLDMISLSSFAARDLGRQSHRAFLDHEAPILIIEDMDLSQLSEKQGIEQVIVSPLRVAQGDGSPCTVIAKIKDKQE